MVIASTVAQRSVEYYRIKAEKCLRLARMVDDRTAESLEKLAHELLKEAELLDRTRMAEDREDS